ncbi:unnamed protein product [Litomosoides sigmodontis]|uniref:SUN domain-containing protein n=1 Tax=Litomosoides sigmodontis TaxID=42156 RepID=A0A3P6UKP5_LITSI|nr:unnamed protein product [Litomosoides sigmodontis]
MGIFEREPTIGNSNLTQSDLNRLLDLDDTYRTDYTYVKSRSYRLNGSDDYETPRMSRLPLNYYRRKWAFERARKAGLLYYIYFCTCDFMSELIPKAVAMILYIIVNILHIIIRCVWCVINRIFPNPEPTSYLEEYRYSSKEYERSLRQEYEFQSSQTPSQETIWNSQGASSDSLAKRLGLLFANMITLGYFFKNDIQHDRTRNVRRRVRTSSYEYSEDRGPEIDGHLTRTAKQSKGLMESLLFKLFYLTFMAVLSPIKTLEFTIEKISWICGFSCSTYDLRSRTVYKSLLPEETLSYTNRFANFLSGLATSFLLIIFSLIKKVFFLPFIIFCHTLGRFFGSSRSKQTLQQQAVRTSSELHYSVFHVLRVPINFLWSCATDFIFLLVSLLSVPFSIVGIIRERTAYALAYMFGPKAALLVGYEEVRPVKRRGFGTDHKSVAASDGQKMVHTAARNKSQLFPIWGLVKFCLALWKWLFPMVILSLLLIVLYKRYDGRDKLMVDITESISKIRQNLPDVEEWKQNIRYGLNAVPENALYLLSIIPRYLYDRVLYPVKLYGTMMYPRETIEQAIELPKYVYMAGQSMYTKAMTNIYNNDLWYRIPSELYNLGKLAIIHFFESVSVLGSRVCDMIQQVSIIWEWIRADRISENIMDMLLYVRNLMSSVSQVLSTLLSYLISVASQVILLVNQKTKSVISSKGFNQQQIEWTLEHLRYEKESLESEVLQLRREREEEENRYKNIHKALQIVEKSTSAMTTDNRMDESLVNEKLLHYKNDENFLNYMASLRKSDDEELKKRLLAIEKRLMERLDILSEKIENKIAQKIIRTSEHDAGESALYNELSELSSAVGNLRTQFDQLRQEKEAKIAKFAHSIMARDIKQSDVLNILKTELNKEVKDDLDKELSSSLSRFEKASHEEREAFRLDIMKAVENRVVALLASHIAEKNNDVPDTKLSSVLGLSESDFMMIKKMITDALDTYDADKTGKVDYALESSGASVISTRCTETYKENSRLESVFGIPLWYSSYSPRAVIQHRTLAAGECWAFRGKGYLTIKLSHPIYITEVSYEHLHSTLHPDGVLKSAPKLFEVYSYKTFDDLKSKSLVGQYEYDIKGRALQTFHAQNELNTSVSVVELVVQSNWGSDYTCLYRFRVHGQKA